MPVTKLFLSNKMSHSESLIGGNSSCVDCFVVVFVTKFVCVALTVLELALQTKLAFNSQICLPLSPQG